MFVQKIQYNAWIDIAAKLDYNTHSLTIGLITKIRDSINSLVLVKFCNLFNQSCLIYQVWKLRYNNTVLTIVHRLNIRYGPYTDLAASGTISFVNSGITKNYASGRKIRSLNNIDQLIDIGLFLFNIVINQLNNRMNHITKIMWRNIGCHTDCDTGRSVY